MNHQPPRARALDIPFPIRRFRRIRFRHGVYCPRCGHAASQRWGRFAGRQRYRCLGCGRTFSDFTGTPLAYLKRIELWEAFSVSLLGRLSLRACAKRLGLHVSTCFRWRHRLLAGLVASESVELTHRASVGVTWVPHSEKGSRSLSRPPRRGRYDGFPSGTEVAWLVVACDVSGRSLGTVTGAREPQVPDLVCVLEGRVRAGTMLLSRSGRFSRIARAADHLGLPFRRERALGVGASPARPEPARLHVLRWKRWMRRFHGVATEYLAHYLVWFRLLDVITGRCTRPGSPGQLLAGEFP